MLLPMYRSKLVIIVYTNMTTDHVLLDSFNPSLFSFIY